MALSSVSPAVVDVAQWQRDNSVRVNTHHDVDGSLKIVDSPSFTLADHHAVAVAGTATWTPMETTGVAALAPHPLTWPEAFEHVGIGVCIAVGGVAAIVALGKAFS